MKTFKYSALLPNSKRVDSTIRAKSEDDVATALRSKGWKIISVKEVNSSKDIQLFKGGVSTVEKANFCRYMSVMIRSGLSIGEAVEIVHSETESAKMKEILHELMFDLQQGEEMSVSFKKYPEVFDEIFLALISAGEKSGSIEKTFTYLAEQQYSSHRLNKKIKGAMMYPAVIFSAMFAVGVLMMTFVMPKLGSVFLKMKIPLPTPTRLLLEFGNFMGENTFLVLSSLGLFIGVIVVLFKFYKTRRVIMSIIANAPVIKNLFEKIDLARFSQTLASLLQSGVPIIQSLHIAGKVFTQTKMIKLSKKFNQSLSEGKTIASVLTSEGKVFPSLMTQTIKTGEKTGTLDTILFELADFYEAELEDALKEFTTILEPMIMLVIGVAVGAMVVMIIAPVYSVLGGMQNS